MRFILKTILALLLVYSVVLAQNKLTMTNNFAIKPAPYSDWKTPLSLSESLPEDFPKIIIDSVDNPTPGHIVMECFQVSTADANYIMITDEKGNVEYYNKPENQGVDFKMQPNGRFSYASKVALGDKYQAGPLTVQSILVQHNVLDQNYNIIDTIQMQNEYLADMHEFVILPNGNYLAVAYEGIPIDMSKIIPNGNPNTKVVQTVFQELDKDKNCVFQWRSLDFVPLLDTKDDPRKAIFEHVHGNSMFLDKDGNLIVSFPTSFEIVKIDMVSGKILWRFGGDKGEFEIIGDNEVDKPQYFRMQHDAHRLDNGNLIFYDNAVQKKSGWNSRAVEYKFDEENRKAELVWEYKHNPPISAFAMGSVQRLKNGNTLINWGLIFLGLQKGMTEVTADKKITYEMTLPATTFSYRAHKYDFPPCQPIANIDKFEMFEGNTYKFEEKDAKTGIEIYFEKLNGFIYNTVNAKKYDCAPLDPVFESEAPVVLKCRYEITPMFINSFTSELRIDVNSLPPHTNPNDLKIYYRKDFNKGTFTELSTEYNLTEKVITATTSEFGEFIVGFERKAEEIFAPVLHTPKNNKQLINDTPVKLVWSSTGRYDKFRMQISTDKDFANIVYDTSNVRIPIITLDNLNPDRKYYWRSQTMYRNLVSAWSEVGEFNLSNEFLTVQYPKGGESLSTDSTYVIRWNTNLTDSLKVTLHFDGDIKQEISKGMYSYTNGISWKIPSNMPAGKTYSIRLTSMKNGSIIAESGVFSINPSVSVNDDITFNSNLEIAPNPASEFTNISFYAQSGSNVKLYIIDQLGTVMKSMLDTKVNLDGNYNIGINTLELSQGVYFCVLTTDNNSTIKKIVVIK